MERLQEIKETFLPGRTFQVRDDLESYKHYNTIDVAEDMLKYGGMLVTVDRITTGWRGEKVYIKIREDDGDWNWSDEMFVDPYMVYDQPVADICESDLFSILV